MNPAPGANPASWLFDPAGSVAKAGRTFQGKPCMSASPWGSWTSPGGRRRSPKTWPRFTRDGGDPLFPCAVPQGDPGIDERDLVESACFRGLPSREVLHPPGIAGIPTGKPAWTGDEPVIPMGKRRFPPGNANCTPGNAAIPRSVSISFQGWEGKKENWWSRRESNPRPLECHSSALPTELRPHEVGRQADALCSEISPRRQGAT